MPAPSKRVPQTELNKFADLFAEAGTVANETGLTPRSLADQNKELLAAIQALLAVGKTYQDEAGQKAVAQARAAIAKSTGAA
jgi:hypothetical protein